MSNEMMSVDELAQYLSIKPVTLYKLLRHGKVPGFKVGGVWRFRKDTIDKWISEGEKTAFDKDVLEQELSSVHDSSKQQYECGVCGIIVQGVPVFSCEAEDCNAPICERCWSMHQRHFCKNHREISPNPVAYEQPAVVAAKGLSPAASSMLAAESSFIELVRSQFSERKYLYKPSDCSLVPFTLAWNFIKESSELSQIMKHQSCSFSAMEIPRVMPTNRTLFYSVDIPAGAIGQSSEKVLFEARFMARWENIVAGEDGADPIKMSELSPILKDIVDRARKEKSRKLIAMFAPSGWSDEAISYIAPVSAGIEGGQTPRFASPDASVILIGPSPEDCVYDKTDPLSVFMAPLLSPELPRDTLRKCIATVEDSLVGARYISLETLARDLEYRKHVIQDAMNHIAAVSGEFRLEEVPGVGMTLKRRSADSGSR